MTDGPGKTVQYRLRIGMGVRMPVPMTMSFLLAMHMCMLIYGSVGSRMRMLFF